jgi:hypothetical protein
MLKCLLADEWRPDPAVGPSRGSGMAPDLAAGRPGCHMRSGGLDSNPAVRPSVRLRRWATRWPTRPGSRQSRCRRRLRRAGSWGTPPIWAPRTTVSRRCDGTMNHVLTKAVLLAAAPEVVSRPNRSATPASRAPVPVAVPGLAGERGDLEGRDRGVPGVAGARDRAASGCFGVGRIRATTLAHDYRPEAR